MALRVQISAAISIIDTAAPDGGQTRIEQAVQKIFELLNGTANGQADLAFIDQRSVNASSNDDIDLNGALVNARGAAVNFAEVVAVLIINEQIDGTLNTTNLTVGGEGSAEAQLWFAAAGDKEVLKPSDISLHYSKTGWAVAGGSTDKLRIANASGATNTYQIAIIGRSA